MDFRSSIEKLREWGSANRQVLAAGAFLAIGFMAGLGAGLLSGSGGPAPIIIDKNVKTMVLRPSDGRSETESAALGNFVASINGQAYYPKDCAAAQRIKEENRIWFETAPEAEAEGYRPAQNCK